MQQVFRLKNGELILDDEKLIIRDDAVSLRRKALLSSGMWTAYGILSVLRYQKTGDQFLLWSGLFIGIAHAILFMVFLWQSNRCELAWAEIQSVKLARPFNNKYLSVKLKEGRVRKIQPSAGTEEELRKHIAARLNV